MQRGRAYRRHQRHRSWRKMERIAREVWREQFEPFAYSDEEIADMVRHRFKNRKSCSCYMCGNPRHQMHGKDLYTVQERRASQDARQQLEECGR